MVKKIEVDESHELKRVRITLSQSEVNQLSWGMELLNSGQAKYEFSAETKDQILVMRFFRLTDHEELKRIQRDNMLFVILLFALLVLGILAIFRLILYLLNG